MHSIFRVKLEAPLDKGLCPNCWGGQEREGECIDRAVDRERDIINGERTAPTAFVRHFVEDRMMDSGRKRKATAWWVCAVRAEKNTYASKPTDPG